MDYKLINKIIDDVYGEFGSNYENALRDLFYEYDRQKEVLDKIKEIIKNDIRIDDEYPDYMEMLLKDYKKLNELLEEIE